MHLGSVFNLLAVAVTLVAAVASVTAFARASFAKAQIEALRGDRDDLQERCDRLENDLAATKDQLETEKGKVAVLEGITIGKEHLVTIENLLKRHDENVVKAVTGLKELITNERRT